MSSCWDRIDHLAWSRALARLSMSFSIVVSTWWTFVHCNWSSSSWKSSWCLKIIFDLKNVSAWHKTNIREGERSWHLLESVDGEHFQEREKLRRRYGFFSRERAVLARENEEKFVARKINFSSSHTPLSLDYNFSSSLGVIIISFSRWKVENTHGFPHVLFSVWKMRIFLFSNDPNFLISFKLSLGKDQKTQNDLFII